MPDSLSTLRLAADWNGRRQVATVVPWRRSDALATLLHEASHTFQKRRRRSRSTRFPEAGPSSFPEDDPTALSLLAAKAEWLARALEADEPVIRASAIRTALQARRDRCRRIGPIICRDERAIELHEGSAQYVGCRMVRRARGKDSRENLGREGLASDLRAPRLLNATGRLTYCTMGEAWLVLLDEQREDSWHRSAETNPPDRLVAEVVGEGPSGEPPGSGVADGVRTRVQAALEARNRRVCWTVRGRKTCSDQVGARSEGPHRLDSRDATIEADSALVVVERDRVVVSIRAGG